MVKIVIYSNLFCIFSIYLITSIFMDILQPLILGIYICSRIPAYLQSFDNLQSTCVHQQRVYRHSLSSALQEIFQATGCIIYFIFMVLQLSWNSHRINHFSWVISIILGAGLLIPSSAPASYDSRHYDRSGNSFVYPTLPNAIIPQANGIWTSQPSVSCSSLFSVSSFCSLLS